MSLAVILAVGTLLAAQAPRHAFFLADVMSAQEGSSLQSTPQATPAQENPKQTAPPNAPNESSKPTEPDGKPDQPASPPSSEPSLPAANPPESNPPKPTPKTVPAATKRKHPNKTASQAGSAPAKRVVRNGSTADPVVQLSPGITDIQASDQRQTTAELLASTEANLKTISGRQLNPSQQEAANQIRRYMTQAKDADNAGDLQRARNLAFKAHLLSDDLIKH